MTDAPTEAVPTFDDPDTALDPDLARTIAEAPISEAIFTALGAASACWDNLEAAGVFESTRCRSIGTALVARFDAEPRLGLATTEQLMSELAARFSLVEGDLTLANDIQRLAADLPPETLAYRTVDGHPDPAEAAAGDHRG